MSEEEFDELLDLMSENNLTQHGADTLYGEIVSRKINTRLEIERLNNIINELEKILNENVELTYVHNGKRQYNKTLTEGGLLFRDYIKSKLQELKGSDK